jgi:hypothetical protein
VLASDYVIAILANAMWNERSQDSILGMTACGLVIRNRVLAGWESGDWIANIKNYPKYDANPATEPQIPEIGDPIRNDLFRRCLGIAANIYSGLERDITFGALRAARLDQCSEDFANKIVRPKDPLTGLQLHPRCAQIGLRSFFK